MKVKFIVFGSPQGKARPRFVNRGKFMKAYTPDATVDYENQIRAEFYRQCGKRRFGDNDMLDMRIMAYYSIPASTSKKKQKAMEEGEMRPTKKPDFDNIGKVVADALNSIAYRDDAQVVDSQIRKFYSRNPRLEVTIQTASKR